LDSEDRHESIAQDGSARTPRPAGRLLRVLGLLVLAVVVLWVLFFHVFPWVERNLSDPTLGSTHVSSMT